MSQHILCSKVREVAGLLRSNSRKKNRPFHWKNHTTHARTTYVELVENLCRRFKKRTFLPIFGSEKEFLSQSFFTFVSVIRSQSRICTLLFSILCHHVIKDKSHQAPNNFEIKTKQQSHYEYESRPYRKCR
jgi:hypothetical protein